MAYPAKLLAPGETIVYELKPHWRALIVPFFFFLIELFLLTWLLMAISGSIPRWIIAVVFVLVVIVWSIVPFLRWLTTQYVFTDRRIIVRKGLITKQGKDMPLSKTNNISFNQGLLGRMFNFGNLDIDSGNVDGSLLINDVPNVEEIQRDVYRLVEEDEARRRTGGA